jgi:hypothetical protein
MLSFFPILLPNINTHNMFLPDVLFPPSRLFSYAEHIKHITVRMGQRTEFWSFPGRSLSGHISLDKSFSNSIYNNYTQGRIKYFKSTANKWKMYYVSNLQSLERRRTSPNSEGKDTRPCVGPGARMCIKLRHTCAI